MEPNTEQYRALLKKNREFFEGLNTTLHGMLEHLPEGARTQINAIKTSVNAVLEKMPATDQVPATMDAACALNYLAEALARTNEMAIQITDGLRKMQDDWTSSLNNRIQEAITSKLTSGDFLEKQKATDLVTEAHRAGRTEALNEVKVVETRRTALATAGLPIPAEEILKLTEDDFKARQDKAKDHAEKLKATGLSLNGTIGQIAWLDEPAFATELTRTQEILEHAKASVGNRRLEPLLGAGAGTTGVGGAF